jgi:hypothetical protein
VTVRIARVLAALAVLAVAVVAGWVSFGHIAALALAHGYSPATSRMLPISVDGLIVAASLALLTGSAPRLSRSGLALGIVATLAANVAAGAQFGPVGALASVWPAVAFVVASEILLKMLRVTRETPQASTEPGTVSDLPVVDPDDVPGIEPVSVPASTVPTPPTPKVQTVATGRARRRAPAGRAKAPERLFATELATGQTPSLREIKRRAGCGTDRARAIRDQLAQIMQEVPEAA